MSPVPLELLPLRILELILDRETDASVLETEWDLETETEVTSLMNEIRKRLPSRALSVRGFPRLSRLLDATERVLRLEEEGRSATLRELYYERLDLFPQQAALNRTVEDLCKLVGMERGMLRLLPGERGRVGGPITFRSGGACLKVIERGGSGVLIGDSLMDAEIICDARRVLVVEKDAVFQTLVEQRLFDRIPTVIVTGRGYPDFATRRFVKRLVDDLGLEGLYLGDLDPHGIRIFLTYLSGGLSILSKQRGEGEGIRGLKWIGLHSADTEELPPETAIPLTQRDRSAIRSLMALPIVKSSPALQRELQFLSRMGKKWELEALSTLRDDSRLLHGGGSQTGEGQRPGTSRWDVYGEEESVHPGAGPAQDVMVRSWLPDKMIGRLWLHVEH